MLGLFEFLFNSDVQGSTKWRKEKMARQILNGKRGL